MANHTLPPNPVAPAHVKRFRTNPVEIAIFSVISLVFCNSVYNLFYEQGGFKPAALTAMSANPVSEGRAPASVAQPAFVNLEVGCEAEAEQTTPAGKVRLTGAICPGARNPASATDGASADVGQLVKVTVNNGANKFAATVFTDVNAGKYSTDYIPLNQGKNPIRLEFSYRDGRVVGQDFNVVRN